MKLYCMCKITGDVPSQARDTQGFGPVDNQVYLAPNRIAPFSEEDIAENKRNKDEIPWRPVVLSREMVCIKKGLRQKVALEPVPNLWAKTKEEAREDAEKLKSARRYYMESSLPFPNVDLYKCPICGAVICVEE